MSTRLTHEGIGLSSIRQINALPEAAKQALYRSLIPDRLLGEHDLGLSPLRGAPLVQIRCQEDTGSVEIDVRHPMDTRDAMLYVQMADTASQQIEVLLMVVNDPSAPRFDVDRDWRGEQTKCGTASRNIPAEQRAMSAGLAPGQVRKGLRLACEMIPVMEAFAGNLGKDRFFIEPLAYHNAIMFERYGFAYMTGGADMEEIDRGFQPGGTLFARLDGSTPFRQPGAEKSIRGRSWAIHDGILGQPWTGVCMYKRLHCDAGICTFPDATY
jgi:hypothetical protein